MLVIKQWVEGKRIAMSRGNQRNAKRERVPRSAINLAYESDSDLRLFTSASAKALVSVNVSTSIIDEDGNNKKNIKDPLELSTEPCTGRSSSTSGCSCGNCRALHGLAECGVCLESLQSAEIKACPVCANVVCAGCAGRLACCAFCRSSRPPERNRALERLIDRLLLPCRNYRSGCKMSLDGESRLTHESICNFSAIGCPVGRGVCGWRGTVASVQTHLHGSHNLQPLHDHGITVEIHSFRSRAKASDGRVYTVCLACHEQLFVIRVVLFQGRLRLCFTRLGHEAAQPLEARPGRYGVSVAIRAHAGRRLRGLVPFGRYDRESREVTLTCENLYPAEDKKSVTTTTASVARKESSIRSSTQRAGEGDSWCNEDLVKIDLLVKRLEESS